MVNLVISCELADGAAQRGETSTLVRGLGNELIGAKSLNVIDVHVGLAHEYIRKQCLNTAVDLGLRPETPVVSVNYDSTSDLGLEFRAQHPQHIARSTSISSKAHRPCVWEHKTLRCPCSLGRKVEKKTTLSFEEVQWFAKHNRN